MRGKIGSPGVAVKRYQRKKIRRAFTRPILECGGLPPLFLPSTPLLLAEARSLRSALSSLSRNLSSRAPRGICFLLATRHPNHCVLTVVAFVISVIAIALTVAFAVD
jgi:hypothetical protein